MYSHSEVFSEIDGELMPVSLSELVTDQLEIPGATVTLRPLIEGDASDYYALIAFDPDHLRQFGDKTADKYPVPEAVRDSIIDPENPFKLRFGIWDNETMVGSINLEPAEDESATIGYWVGKEYVGKGYASDALATLVDFAFGPLGYKELEAEAASDNTASCKTLERCGFMQTGEFRGREYIDKDGQPQNRIYIVYELLM